MTIIDFEKFNNKKKNKYKNVKCVCTSGHTHASKGEAGYCNMLSIIKKAGKIIDYDVQETFRLYALDKYICSHRVDFLIYENDGSVSVNEFKGTATRDWIIKKKLFEANYPNIKYEVVRKRH